MSVNTLWMSEYMSVNFSNTIENKKENHRNILEINQLFIIQNYLYHISSWFNFSFISNLHIFSVAVVIVFPRCVSPLCFPVVGSGRGNGGDFLGSRTLSPSHQPIPNCLKQHVFFPVDQCFSIRSTVQDMFELSFHFSCFDRRSFFIFMNHWILPGWPEVDSWLLVNGGVAQSHRSHTALEPWQMNSSWQTATGLLGFWIISIVEDFATWLMAWSWIFLALPKPFCLNHPSLTPLHHEKRLWLPRFSLWLPSICKASKMPWTFCFGHHHGILKKLNGYILKWEDHHQT